jgi:hypothetical protein
MNKKLDNFKIEELEQRFETGRWIEDITLTLIYEDTKISGTWDGQI